ncbi:hypothetical protein QYF61_022808 [Mycteria americana]|uniref:Peptidase A2 domain-containing protein n=1 Tax=Mycteria americana TaxID=33587 RepID=A0AAN7SFU1_MYCAM|nr:hypothetical protein QYF61_022808 [Mycteria americana]
MMERRIQYLRELAVLQSSKDPDEVKCTRPMWQKLVQSSPASHGNSLAVLTWKDREGPAKLSWKVQQLKEDRFFSPPVWTSISAIRSQHSSAQERGYRGYTPQGTLWFFLHDHGEDMRKWDGKSTLTLEARVRELQGKKITKGGSSRKIAAPVDSSPDRVEGLILLLMLMKELLTHIYKKWEYKAPVDTGAQCGLMPSSYIRAEPICISGVTGGSQQLTVLEPQVSLTGNEWQKHSIVTGPEIPCILGIDYLRRGYLKDSKEYWWAFGIAALEMEEIHRIIESLRLEKTSRII